MEMSSLGGRWPKKLYIFFVFDGAVPLDGERVVFDDGEGSTAPGTPSPDMMDTVLARLVFWLLDLEAASHGSSAVTSLVTPP